LKKTTPRVRGALPEMGVTKRPSQRLAFRSYLLPV
jgi:hypothetical protein